MTSTENQVTPLKDSTLENIDDNNDIIRNANEIFENDLNDILNDETDNENLSKPVQSSNGRNSTTPSPMPSNIAKLLRSVSVTPTRLKQLKKIVNRAAQRRKTFTVFGKFPIVCDALKARGWVQNFDISKLTIPKQRQSEDDVKLVASLESRCSDSEERIVITRLLKDIPVNFIWAMGEGHIDWNSISRTTIISRFPRAFFTTKTGLCMYLEQSHWFCEAGIAETRFPRCYNIQTQGDYFAFIKDFRITACLSLLQTVVMEINKSTEQLFQMVGKVPLSTIEFAIKRCSEYVASEEHEDIDRDVEEKIWDHQWDQFLTFYYQIVHEKVPFEPATEIQIKAIQLCCKVCLDSVTPHWPQLNLDGVFNLWIVKPGAKSRGRGIEVMNNLEQITSKIGIVQTNDSSFVIQKYIERPLLIYETKFDIRQWFLVTSAYPLTIWMYRESYLRFCSQIFSLNNMHESVHLSNNAVQVRYKNQEKRDNTLPDENMWDCYTFQAYLRTKGLADKWDEIIYPGMKECFTSALLSSQEHMESRPNSFELYGADFMLSEDLSPWLLEINSSPCMQPTTSVTARLCAQCLEDVIKVVIDKRIDKDADTGMFELAYKQHVSHPQPYTGMNLTLKGVKISPRQINKISWAQANEEREVKSPTLQEALKRLNRELSGKEIKIKDRSKMMKLSKSKKSTNSSCKSTDTDETENENGQEKKEKNQKTYKVHSCLKTSQQLNAYAKYKRHDEALRRFRMQQCNVNFNKKITSAVQSTELMNWKRKIDKTREECKLATAKLNEPKKINKLPKMHREIIDSESIDINNNDEIKRKISSHLPDINNNIAINSFSIINKDVLERLKIKSAMTLTNPESLLTISNIWQTKVN